MTPFVILLPHINRQLIGTFFGAIAPRCDWLYRPPWKLLGSNLRVGQFKGLTNDGL